MRILHLLDHSAPHRSAYALRTTAILREQRAMGLHTIQMTGPRQGGAEPERNRDGWHYFRTAPAAHSRLALLRQIGAVNLIARRLRRVVQLTRPDLLHAHSPAENALAALRVGRQLALPVLFELHPAWSTRGAGLRHRLARAVETWAARRADAVATSSEAQRRQLQAGGVPPTALTVVPNGVDLHQFVKPSGRDAQLAQQLGLGAGPVIGFVGAFHRHEGLELLLAAMPALLRARPGLRLLLAGGGPHEAWLRERAAQMALGASVVFAGRAALERSAAHHALIDLLVYPRLPHPQAELVANTRLLEAMAQGCLVAASDVGAHRELVEHGRTGVLFQAGSADALADAVLVLLSATGRWPAMRGAARWFVEYHRTWELSAGRYAPLYRRLLERRKRR